MTVAEKVVDRIQWRSEAQVYFRGAVDDEGDGDYERYHLDVHDTVIEVKGQYKDGTVFEWNDEMDEMPDEIKAALIQVGYYGF